MFLSDSKKQWIFGPGYFAQRTGVAKEDISPSSQWRHIVTHSEYRSFKIR